MGAAFGLDLRTGFVFWLFIGSPLRYNLGVLKRLWLACSLLWAVLFLATAESSNGFTIFMAFGPAIVVALLWRAGRWVASGR